MESPFFITIKKKEKTMATFWTQAEVDLSVDDIYENLSDREVKKLIDLLVSEGEVISTNIDKNESMSFLDEEWKKTLINLMNNRHRLSNEDEETIKTIANKL
jgi:ribonucleotide reductase beta subunit family protein with ferritin-like domain